jgi:3-oxoadipate enol-lactonase
MATYKIDQSNEIYYEYVAPKAGGKTFVFVNALTGSTSAWNGDIGNKIVNEGNGYLAYNFRGQEKSKFDKGLTLDTNMIVSDLVLLINSLDLKNIILSRTINRWFVCSSCY